MHVNEVPLVPPGSYSPSAATIRGRRIALQGVPTSVAPLGGRPRSVLSISSRLVPTQQNLQAIRGSTLIAAATGNVTSNGVAAAAPADDSARLLVEVMEPLPAPLHEVPQLLLQAWLGLKGPEHLKFTQTEHGLRDTPGACLLVAGTRIESGKRRHAVLALLLASKSQLNAAKDLSAVAAAATSAGDPAGLMAQFTGSRLHWGSVRSPGARWQAPEPGWNTQPADSVDAGGGAWQSAFQACPTNVGPVHVLLLQLPADDGAPQAIASIVKAPANRWLGDATTRKDFYFDLQALPVSEPLLTPEAAEAAEKEAEAAAKDPPATAEGKAEKGADQVAASDVLVHYLRLDDGGPFQPLNALKLARAPPPRGAAAAAAASEAAAAARRARAQRSGLPRQPELPPPWAEGPPRDKTQVVTMLGEHLVAAAQQRLAEWVARQEGLEVIGDTPEVAEFKVEGFAAPVAAAITALKPAAGAEAKDTGGATIGAQGPVAVVSLVADEGLAGAPKGLVLHWGAASSVSSCELAEELPEGWCTEPSVSWDVGRWVWATPFEHAKVGEGSNALPAGCYHLILALPLQGVFGSGGRLVFELRTAKGQWLRSAETSTSFILHLEGAARAAGLPAISRTATDPAVSTMATAAVESRAAVPPAAGDVAAGPVGEAVEAEVAPDVPSAGILRPPGGDASVDEPDPDSPGQRGIAGSGSERKPRSVVGAAPAVGQPSDANGTTSATAAGHLKGVRGSLATPYDLTAADAADEAWDVRKLLSQADLEDEASSLGPVPDGVVSEIRSEEHRAERSLMHRFGIAAELLRRHGAAKGTKERLGADSARALGAVAVWLRLSGLRLLRWNVNYNVKPREISAALDGLGDALVQAFEAGPPSARGLALLALASAGRGGEGALGQRIRDEILTIQHRSGAKGGMLEQWHQKLHNNSSPDDVVICQALLAYIRSGLDLAQYWSTLNAAGVTAERLASYDRPVTHEPDFTEAQAAILEGDLAAYLDSLVAVHGGADLRSAGEAVMGYTRPAVKGKAIVVEPVPGVATQELAAVLLRLSELQPEGQQGAPSDQIEHALTLMRLAVQGRRLLSEPIAGGNSACSGRLKDVIWLDMALATACRTAAESVMHHVTAAATAVGADQGAARANGGSGNGNGGADPLSWALRLLMPAVENAALSPGSVTAGSPGVLRYELALACNQMRQLMRDKASSKASRALQALAISDRIGGVLSASASATQAALQPTADALGLALGISDTSSGAAVVVSMLSEEEVRAGPAAALSNMLAALQPLLLALAGASGWQVISRGAGVALAGPMVRVASLTDAAATAAAAGARRPLLLVERLRGEEDVPPGCGGVVVFGHCPDVLCHAAVRARGAGIPLVACLDARQAARVEEMVGKEVVLHIVAEAVELRLASDKDAALVAACGPSEAQPAQEQSRDSQGVAAAPPAGWCGRWVLPLASFAPGVVGAKAANTLRLSRGLPSWLWVPWSLSLPFGTLEEGVMRDPANEEVAAGVWKLEGQLAEGMDRDSQEDLLHKIRSCVMRLKAPEALHEALRHALQEQQQQQQDHLQQEIPEDLVAGVWNATVRVWASQWSSGAQTAIRNARLPWSHLRMAVLLQPVVPVRYAFVAHTRSPTTGSRDEVYVEVVPGMGEALVSGSFPGRALGAAVSRAALERAIDEAPPGALPAGATNAVHGGGGSLARGDGLTGLVGGAVQSWLGGGGRSGSSDKGAGPLGQVPSLDALRRSVRCVSYPSKSHGMPAPNQPAAGSGPAAMVLMARSDSNAEDLPGCSGAGLFESHPTADLPRQLVDYAPDPICRDEAAALRVLWAAGLAAVAAERALGTRCGDSQGGGAGGEQEAQDVEGGIDWDGNVWVLQSRAQA